MQSGSRLDSFREPFFRTSAFSPPTLTILTRTHVKNDLDAYVCLFKECDTPDQLYSHSEDWLKHMREHALRWRCKSNSHGPLAFDTRDKYTEHMKEAHKKVFSNTELHILADRNARTIRPLFETCPLCGLNDIAKGANIEEHITGHLRFLALKSLPTFQDEVSQSSDAESVSSQVSKPHKRSTIENDPDKHANLTFDDNEENRIVEQCSEIDSSSLSPYKQYSEPRNYVSVAGSLPGRGDSQLIEKSRAFVETALLISSTEGRQFEWGFVIKDLEASMNIKDDPILQNLALRQLPLYAPKVNPKQRGIDTDSIGQRYTPVDDGTEDEGAAVSASKTDHQGPIPVSNSYSVNPSEADNDTNPAVLGDGQNSDIPQDTEHSHERIHEQTRSGSESRERRVGAPSSSPIPLPVEVNARPRSPTLSSNLKQSHGDILDLQQRSEVDHISNVPVSDSVSLEISPQTQTYNSILIKSDVLGNLNGPQFKNADTLENIDLDDMISRLLKSARFSSKKLCLSHEEIRSICMASREIFLSQPVLLELAAPLKIVGDIHGQYTDLIRIFQLSGFPPTVNYLFLGDYVDRGKRSLETILLLLCYKLKYPENFFLLRGNHECANVTRVYGFYDECKRRCDVRIWKTFIDIFNCLPVASIVADKIFCVHGGLSPSLLDAKEIRQLNRPTDVPDYGLLSDLLWSDPADMEKGWEPNERGVSYCFGKSEIKNFLSFNDFDLICRAHMVVEDGYEFFEDRLLVTLFSAPNVSIPSFLAGPYYYHQRISISLHLLLF